MRFRQGRLHFQSFFFSSLIATLLSNHSLAESETETVSLTHIPVSFSLEATLEAVNQSTVSAQTQGRINAIHYDVNDVVEAGALLLTIEDTQQRASLAQAEAGLAQAIAQNEDAQIVLQRNQKLHQQGTLSQGKLDSSEAQAKSAAAMVTAAKAGVEQAREQLAYTQVRAPYAGLVKDRHVEIGELVAPGTPLMTGMSLAHVRAIADLPQRLAQRYESASQISVQIEDQTIQPDTVTLFPFADRQHHSVRLRANLPATETLLTQHTTLSARQLLPGNWARLIFTYDQRQAIVIPESAIIRRSHMAAVLLQQQERTVLRQVRLGNRLQGNPAQGNSSQSNIEVLSGLSEGDILFVDGYARLAEVSQNEQ